MLEKYLVIHPDGHIDWMETEHEMLLDACYKAIGCNCVENVRTVIPDVCLIVDESGKIKHPPQPHNPYASNFYQGWLSGNDNIVGTVVVAAIHLVDGDSDWVPLNVLEMDAVEWMLASMGILPE